MKISLTFLFVLTINMGFAQYSVSQSRTNSYASNFNKSSNRLQPIKTLNFSQLYLNENGDYLENNLGSSSSISINQSKLSYSFFQDSTVVKEKWYKTDTGVSLLVAGGLITAGTIMHFNTDFKVGVKDEINRYLPNFHDDIDDYTQYVPYAAVFALDAAGIKSKHSTYRKISTIGTAIGINLIVVQGLKYSIAEPRPDGSSNNSFPSGHTATAFMGAHIFHKEYKHRSPFYSIAAYTLATFTGVMRQLNDRHWISDVFAGAGIGIGTTELAYFLNDGWWKEKGINEIEITERKINESKPSFLGVKVGYASLVNSTDGNEPGLEAKEGFKISFEGAYFFNRNLGLGGEIGFQSFPNTISDALKAEFDAEGFEVLAQSAGNRLYYFGPHYQMPFGKNILGAKLQAGVISGPNTKIFVREKQNSFDLKEDPPQEFVYADYDPKTSFSWTSGLYYKRVISKNLSLGAFFDYNWADLKYDVTYMDDFNNGAPTYFPKESKTTNYDSYSFGANVNIMLW
ncbi:phosphatase PAP2 family protein [uncultured Algibacter sp.]|uniref:phosphatase PAP2 family protein n=1 Tax=uncultured Algibacter sp. TaxID=298659 RepID=UPI002633D290|nr:phosphatase PAP2 family protein [uncultured Algibacter sp.]